MEDQNLDEYAPIGTKDCEGGCDLNKVEDGNDEFLVCEYCKRILRKI